MKERLNPLTVLGTCLAWILATTFDRTAAFQVFAIVLFAGMLLVFCHIGLLRLLALTVPFALFGFGFLTTNVLFRQDNATAVAVFSRDLAATDAVHAGLVLFLRAIAGGMISLFFAFAVDPGRLVRASMVHLRLAPSIAYALFAAMQIVPDLAAKTNEMRMAAAMRKGRRLHRFPTPGETARLVIPLLAYAIRRACRTAVAMEARGFSPGRPRTTIDVPGFFPADGGFALLGFLPIAVATVL